MARVTLKSRLPEIAAELRPKVGQAVKEGASLVAEDASTRVNLGPPPRHIAESLKVVRMEAAGYLVVAAVASDKGIAYPWVVEFGNAHSPAYPFLIPALEAQADNITYLVTGALRGLALRA